MNKLFKLAETEFNNIDQTIRSYLSLQLGRLGIEYNSSNIFGLILNVIQGVFQNAMIYLEDAIVEQDIKTAQRKQSIYSLARLSGYEPFYGYAASGNLTMNLNLNNGITSNKVYIKNHTQVTHKDSGITYNIILPQDILTVFVNTSFQPRIIPIVEGVFSTQTFTAEGFNLEDFTIDSLLDFDITYLTVKVNNEIWKREANLYDMTYNENAYIVSQSFDGGFSVQFGNTVHGKALSTNDNVSIEYLTHTGTGGNLSLSASKGFKFSSPLYDVEGNEIDGNDYFTLNISSPITGGMYSESLYNVKNMVGYNSRSLVLASEDNFKLFLSRFSFIGYNRIWSEENSLLININALGNMSSMITTSTDYFDLIGDDLLLTSEQKEMIKVTLENSKQVFAGVTVNFVDPILRNFAIICYLKVKTEYSQQEVADNIKTQIANYFLSLTNETTYIPKSELLNYILNLVDGIKSLDISFVSQTNEDAYKTGTWKKYSLTYVNGTYHNEVMDETWTSQESPCLDIFGNINLDSKLEVPTLFGGFNYYPDKSDNTTTMMLDAVNIYYV
jgi:hypothetical protein